MSTAIGPLAGREIVGFPVDERFAGEAEDALKAVTEYTGLWHCVGDRGDEAVLGTIAVLVLVDDELVEARVRTASAPACGWVRINDRPPAMTTGTMCVLPVPAGISNDLGRSWSNAAAARFGGRARGLGVPPRGAATTWAAITWLELLPQGNLVWYRAEHLDLRVGGAVVVLALADDSRLAGYRLPQGLLGVTMAVQPWVAA